VVIFEIGSTLTQLNSFILVFGQRFVGLVDPGSSLYQTYRVPNPAAPYPQDYIIDQNGIVRYWSDEYDPQRIIGIIDGLLETQGIEEGASGTAEGLEIFLSPNPAHESVMITTGGFAGGATVRIYTVTGRLVQRIELVEPAILGIETNLPAGIYLVNLSTAAESVTETLVIVR
jgi:hypothetical protein